MTVTTPCREWQGPLSRPGGYPQRRVGGKLQRIHRWVIETAGEDQFGTPWDRTLDVMHLCDNPPCFRFDHLKLGTRKENQQDMVAKGRAAHGERNGSARLTAETVAEIRAATGTCKEIGARFGISYQHVSDIRTGKRWAFQ